MISSSAAESGPPAPFLMARSMLSPGMFTARALRMAERRRALVSGLAPPCLAARVSSLASLLKTLPFFASTTALMCLTFDHLLWPAMLEIAEFVGMARQLGVAAQNVWEEAVVREGLPVRRV